MQQGLQETISRNWAFNMLTYRDIITYLNNLPRNWMGTIETLDPRTFQMENLLGGTGNNENSLTVLRIKSPVMLSFRAYFGAFEECRVLRLTLHSKHKARSTENRPHQPEGRTVCLMYRTKKSGPSTTNRYRFRNASLQHLLGKKHFK